MTAVLLLVVLVGVGEVEIDLHDRVSDIDVRRDADGALFVVQDGRRLTPAQYIDAVAARQDAQRSHGFLYVLLNITTPWGVAWVAFGLLGQVLFTGRMVLQWLVSEKEKRSTVPVAFWWMSLIGASMLVVYFIWRKDIVGVLGQSTGWFIYTRNLWLIYRVKGAG